MEFTGNSIRRIRDIVPFRYGMGLHFWLNRHQAAGIIGSQFNGGSLPQHKKVCLTAEDKKFLE
jgi:hypothetical protein